MSAAASTATARLLENPFWVLGLPVTATRMELEREAQKLLGMLELGLAAVASYATPLGARPRTAELVRSAVATLRDPARRLAAEIWARARAGQRRRRHPADRRRGPRARGRAGAVAGRSGDPGLEAAVTWFVPILLTLRRRALEARRQHRSGAFVALSAGAALVTVIALWIFGALAVALWLVGLWWLATATALMLAWAYFPWTLARDVAVPLGLPRLASWLGRRSQQFGANRVGAGLVAGAWAVCRQRAPDPTAIARLEAERDGGARIGDCEVLATGLLASARGDGAGARALIESLARLPELTPAARELAAEWLAADDAATGAWARIVTRAQRRAHGKLDVDPIEAGLPDDDLGDVKRPAGGPRALLWPATPATYLLEGVAQRLLDVPGAPGDAALVLRWLEAPARLRTWALVRRAMRAPAAATVAPPAPGAASVAASAEPVAASPSDDARPGDPIALAVGRHVAAVAALDARALTRDHILDAAAAWDVALASTDARTGLLGRALDVGAPPDAGHRVLDELARTAADELADLVIAAELPVDRLHGERAPAPASILATCLRRVHHRLLGELELAITRTATRVAAKRALPAIDEWREACALREAHGRACRIGGLELRRLAFPHLHAELTTWGVGLWNDRKEHALSDAITIWLLAEALAVGDAQAIDCHARNASLPIPARS